MCKALKCCNAKSFVKTLKIENKITPPINVWHRNSADLSKLQEYQSQYPEYCRFLLGSWLLSETDHKHLTKKAIIIIETVNEIMFSNEHMGMEVICTSNFSKMFSEYLSYFIQEDLVIQYDKSHIYLLKNKSIKIPQSKILPSPEMLNEMIKRKDLFKLYSALK
uniref:22 kDa protein n=1 Tax=Caladenia ophiovirus TaxID=2983933 RepID=A0A9N6YK53_9VIRU|nr:TPA_asm: 22 kDa protein [Caladenia ophiovirus]